MLGRRAAFAAVLASVVAFGGGAAVAATHGGSPHTLKPPKLMPVKQGGVTNVHFPCHNRGPVSASL
jgi:hypothetical protein